MTIGPDNISAIVDQDEHFLAVYDRTVEYIRAALSPEIRNVSARGLGYIATMDESLVITREMYRLDDDSVEPMLTVDQTTNRHNSRFIFQPAIFHASLTRRQLPPISEAEPYVSGSRANVDNKV